MFKYLKYIKSKDPAARNYLQIILFYPGVHALFWYKIAHFFWKIKLKFIAEFLTYYVRMFTGIEIHPGCKIGKRLFIDHGFGIVIGETSVIGDDCVIYQGVTLGSKSSSKEKRHPTIKNSCVIGSHAQIIGNIVIEDDVIIGSNAIVTKNVTKGKTIISNNFSI